MKKLLALFLLISLPAHATGLKAVADGVAGQITAIPVPVAQGGTGATALGPCISNANSTLSATIPNRKVTTTSDTILSSDSCDVIQYNNASAIAVAIASASTTGFTSGFGFTMTNIGAGTVTLTPTASTVNGASTLAIPTNTQCSVYSDGTNYLLSSCTALPITIPNLPAGVVTKTLNISINSPATGVQGAAYIFPCAGTIVGYQLTSNLASSSMVLDLWKAANGTIPTITNTITASALPTLSSAQQVQSTTLTGWTTSITAGDELLSNVNSFSTGTAYQFQLFYTVAAGSCNAD